jgi:Fe-S cluster biogenesis protein NfuA
MPDEQLSACVERIDVLLSKVEALPDAALRQDVQEIVKCLLSYHGVALARLLRLALHEGDDGATPLASLLVRDELVESLLLLHGLHPADQETRVLAAVERVRPLLQSHGGNVELVCIDEGVVRLRLQGSCHGCPSSAATVKSRIESAIYESAPEVQSIEVEEPVESPPTGGFVGIEKLSAV